MHSPNIIRSLPGYTVLWFPVEGQPVIRIERIEIGSHFLGFEIF